MTDTHQTNSNVPVVRCAILTVSDTRTAETDIGGRVLRESCEAAGHRVVHQAIVPDDADAIRTAVRAACAHSDCDVVLLTGGTGIAPRDVTIEAVSEILEKRLDGFGELFRMLSFREVGPRAMLSRAIAGVHNGRAVFAIPGSPAAVRFAMNELILPVLSHLVGLLRTDPSASRGPQTSS